MSDELNEKISREYNWKNNTQTWLSSSGIINWNNLSEEFSSSLWWSIIISHTLEFLAINFLFFIFSFPLPFFLVSLRGNL